MQRVAADIFLGHRNQAALFLRGHHLGGIAKAAIGLGLHFHKYYRGLVLGDDVDLAKAGTIAPVEYLIPKTFKFGTGQVLAIEAKLLSGVRHAYGTAILMPKVPGCHRARVPRCVVRECRGPGR